MNGFPLSSEGSCGKYLVDHLKMRNRRELNSNCHELSGTVRELSEKDAEKQLIVKYSEILKNMFSNSGKLLHNRRELMQNFWVILGEWLKKLQDAEKQLIVKKSV